MIIKKQYAQSALSPSVVEPRAFPSSEGAPTQPVDPYQQEISPEDFESGTLKDRRRNDRRQGYRRIEDQELISRAEEEANAIRENAAQEGFQEGLNQAQAEIEALQESIQGLLEAKEKALNSAADELAAMAIEIAERIIKTEVTCDETLVRLIVQQTIAKVSQDQKHVLVKVNPIEVKFLRESIKEDPIVSDAVEVLVMEDDSVDPGSCIIETRAGQIDARISTQLEILKRMVLTGGKF